MISSDESLAGQVTIARLTAEAADGRLQLRWCIPKHLYRRPRRHQTIAQHAEYNRFRIWLREAPELFGRDPIMPHAEDPTPSTGELVCAGPIAPRHGRWYEWTFPGVRIGQTYRCYVSGAEGLPAGPVPVKIRDPRVWWTAEILERRLAQFTEACPVPFDRDIIGHTRLGRPIPVLRIGAGEVTVVLAAAVHPGESGPELLLGAVRHLVETDPRLLDQVRLLVVPCANPDSRERLAKGHPFYIRTNAGGVDLNRNFDDNWLQVSQSYGESSDDPGGETWRGPSPVSEPESRALRDLCEAQPPHAVIAYHWVGGISAPPMNYHMGIYDWDDWDQRDTAYERRAREFANVYGCAFFDTAEPEPWYPLPSIAPGSFEGWAARRFGALGYAMEGGRDPDSCQAGLDAVSPELLDQFARRHAKALGAFIHCLAAKESAKTL